MATRREIIYLGRDNAIELILKAGDSKTAQDLSGVTHMEAVFSGTTFSSVTSGYFDWQDRTVGSGTTTGWVKLTFGQATTLSPGAYKAELIVYDATWDDGLLWGTVPIRVKG